MRDYFVFDLSSIPAKDTVTAVTLTADSACSSTVAGSYPWSAFFYSTDPTAIANLEAPNLQAAGWPFFTALGAGPALGTLTVSNELLNSYTMSFNATGVAAVQAALGKHFAIGTTFAESSQDAALLCDIATAGSSMVQLKITAF